MAKEFKLSNDSYLKLQDELKYLKTVREQEVSEQIKEARSFGDLSENSEYDEAKNEQGKLYSRIAEVENILAHAVIIKDEETEEGVVSVTSKVTVEDIEFAETETYTIVGSQEANPMKKLISEDSPFGRALIGKSIGDEVIVEAPMGHIKYRILNVE